MTSAPEKASKDTSVETRGYEGARQAKTRSVSLPRADSDLGNGREARESWACTGGQGRPLEEVRKGDAVKEVSQDQSMQDLVISRLF